MGASKSRPSYNCLVSIAAEGTGLESKFATNSIKPKIEERVVSDLVSRVNQAIDDARKSKLYNTPRNRIDALHDHLTANCSFFFLLLFTSFVMFGMPYILASVGFKPWWIWHACIWPALFVWFPLYPCIVFFFGRLTTLSVRYRVVYDGIIAEVKNWNEQPGNIYEAVYSTPGAINKNPGRDNMEEWEPYPAKLEIFSSRHGRHYGIEVVP